MTSLLISTCPRDALRGIMHDRPYIVISVTDPLDCGGDGTLARLLEDDTRLGVLHLQFADYHQRHFKLEPALQEKAMQPWHARVIKEFIDRERTAWQTLIISCEAGVSRSPSIALAIAEHYGIDRRQIEPCHRNWAVQPINRWCYDLTKEALGKK